MPKFSAVIRKLGINPFVEVPERIVQKLLRDAKQDTGPLPVRGRIHRMPFVTTVVKYAGAWRLYLNTQMRRDAGVDVKDTINVELTYDPKPRIVPMPEKFALALKKNKRAKAAFEKLPASHQKAILSYMNWLKTEEALERAIDKVIQKELKRSP
jgi:Bacteriocin-protection, YdeI or OmpD-Associated/Domain of unknown function (DUF1905)